MANETITFLCPACGIKLTVPSQLAGVTGPCPSCRSLIQAPCSPPLDSSAYQSPLIAPSGTSTTEIPADRHPSAAAPVAPISPPLPVETIPAYQLPHAAPRVAPIPEAVSPQSPAALPREPLQLPTRPPKVESVANQMPGPRDDGNSSTGSRSFSRHPSQTNPFTRLLLLFVFLIASGVLAYGVLTILKRQSKDAPGKGLLSETPARKILPDEPVPPNASTESADPTLPALPVPSPELPAITIPPPPLPDGLTPKTPSAAAREVLDKFLEATTLAARLPLIETGTSEAELALSCLAGPLPAANNILIDAIENNAVEQVADIYHSVDFDAGNNRKNPQTILIRTRGSSDPKIVVDPFLDSYGGRLAAYAKTPSDKAGIFQVIISPLAACYDENVPNREKKLTLKLLPHDNTKEIALAYFDRQSKIAQMLEDGTYSLSYGKAKACTVMLRWNVEDRPETPYLEAIYLKTMDWNP